MIHSIDYAIPDDVTLPTGKLHLLYRVVDSWRESFNPAAFSHLTLRFCGAVQSEDKKEEKNRSRGCFPSVSHPHSVSLRETGLEKKQIQEFGEVATRFQRDVWKTVSRRDFHQMQLPCAGLGHS